MLVLTRKPEEAICIGDSIRVTVVEIRGNKVRLGIEAPPEVRVRRHELPQPDEFEIELVAADTSRRVACIAR